MNRRDFLRAGLASVPVALAGCAPGGGRSRFADGFEAGMGAWTPGAAIGPEVDIDEFDWEVDIADEHAAGGTHSLRIWNEGTYDDGVTWVTHPISIEPGRSYTVSVTAQFWSESASFNTLRDAVVRIGPGRPTREASFPQPGLNTTQLGVTPIGGLREPLWVADGWHTYTCLWETPRLSTDTVYLSLGTAVIWEGDATHYVDDVSVQIE